jgi:hypothetical protein
MSGITKQSIAVVISDERTGLAHRGSITKTRTDWVRGTSPMRISGSITKLERLGEPICEMPSINQTAEGRKKTAA